MGRENPDFIRCIGHNFREAQSSAEKSFINLHHWFDYDEHLNPIIFANPMSMLLCSTIPNTSDVPHQNIHKDWEREKESDMDLVILLPTENVGEGVQVLLGFTFGGMDLLILFLAFFEVSCNSARVT